jgi:hypothetical protein
MSIAALPIALLMGLALKQKYDETKEKDASQPLGDPITNQEPMADSIVKYLQDNQMTLTNDNMNRVADSGVLKQQPFKPKTPPVPKQSADSPPMEGVGAMEQGAFDLEGKNKPSWGATGAALDAAAGVKQPEAEGAANTDTSMKNAPKVDAETVNGVAPQEKTKQQNTMPFGIGALMDVAGPPVNAGANAIASGAKTLGQAAPQMPFGIGSILQALMGRNE